VSTDEIKILCRADPSLQFWAAVFFAEICGYFEAVEHSCNRKPTAADHSQMYDHLRYKVAEFPRQVVHEQLRKAKGEKPATDPLQEIAHEWLKAKTVVKAFVLALRPELTDDQAEHNAAALIARLGHEGMLITEAKEE
jgi:hypothetical protein